MADLMACHAAVSRVLCTISVQLERMCCWSSCARRQGGLWNLNLSGLGKQHEQHAVTRVRSWPDMLRRALMPDGPIMWLRLLAICPAPVRQPARDRQLRHAAYLEKIETYRFYEIVHHVLPDYVYVCYHTSRFFTSSCRDA